MTMTPRSPDHLQETWTIEALQATRDTGQWTGLSTPELIRRGNRARRRRHVLQAGGGLTGVATVVALALTIGPIHRDTDAVPASPAATTDSPETSGISSTEVLLQRLGPDFRAAANPSHGPIEVVPGGPAAKELPIGYGASADIQVLPTRPAGVSAADDPSSLPPLSELCAPSQEKGLVMQACTTEHLPAGRTVQVQRSGLVAGNYKTYGDRWTPGSSDTTTVYYQRPDDSIVRVQLTAYDSPATSTAGRQSKAAAWLPQWTGALERAAADPRVGLPPGAATRHPAATPAQLLTQRENFALQQALGYGFTLNDGTIRLEPGSALEGELPDRRYSTEATVTHLDTADMQKACGADLADCRTITLPDGGKAYAITTAQPWNSTAMDSLTPVDSADIRKTCGPDLSDCRAITQPDGTKLYLTVTPAAKPSPGTAGIDLRTTVYAPGVDGRIFATAVELVSNVPMTEAEQAHQIPANKAWLQALQPQLAQAAAAIAHLDTTRATTTTGPQN
jgi:hypothetical protein